MLLSSPLCMAQEDEVYSVEEKGRTTLRSTFEKKMQGSAAQWEFARAAQDAGNLKTADGRMLYLVRRWPNSQEAPWAQRARADMLYARGKLEKASKEYQYLIDNYSSRMRDYDSVLQSQFEIAQKIMNKRRMRWLFGGYRAPEYAVDYFENVIRNGPQWSRAPEAQFLIGQCHQEAKDLEMAISAYGVLGYRYPDSKYAEEGAWQQIVCLNELRLQYPASMELLTRCVTVTQVFKEVYPKSTYIDRVNQLRNKLYEVMAGKVFDIAEFYAKVPKKADPSIVYFEQLIEEFPKSRLVPAAQKRIDEVKSLMVLRQVPAGTMPAESLPGVNEKETGHAES